MVQNALATSLPSVSQVAYLDYDNLKLKIYVTALSEKDADLIDYLLENRNMHNRRMDINKVRDYATIINLGLWELNGETIVFSCDGNILNAQHRLKAASVSKIPMRSLVVEGIDEDVFSTFDQNYVRSLSVMIGLQHPDLVKIRAGKITAAKAVASVLSLLDMYEKRGSRHAAKNRQLKFEGLSSHPTLISDVTKILSDRELIQRNPSTTSILCFAYYIGSKRDKKATDDFIEMMADRMAVPPGSPVTALRVWASHGIGGIGKAKKGKLVSDVLAHATIKALLAHIEGRRIDMLRIGEKEEWPIF